MALDRVNPFITNPVQQGPNQIGQTPSIPVSPAFEGSQSSGGKGELYSGFNVPQSNGSSNSFLREGALGDQALYGQGNSRLGSKMNVFA